MYSENCTPLLSVIIPTRNRQEYAISSIESILRIPDFDLEIVIQDNSDTRELEEILHRNKQDSRLRYNYTSTPLSFIDNFDKAIKLASGEYVCLIGDDDGINPEIMEATRWAKDNGIETLKPAINVFYIWPKAGISSTKFTNVPENIGKLTIKPFSGKITHTNIELELGKVVRKGGQEYLLTNLPKLYHGIVKRECLDRVREKTGAYFGGLSPDIYAAVSIANVDRKAISIDYPLTLPGVCRQSGSAASMVGMHTGNIEDAPHLNYRGSYTWANLVPCYYSVPTIWADSTVAALQDMGREDLVKAFNMSYLAACCLWMHPQYRKIILHNLYSSFRISGVNSIIGTIQLFFCFFAGPGRLLLKQIVNRLWIILFGKNFIELQNVNNMAEATDTLLQYLKATNRSFKKCVS